MPPIHQPDFEEPATEPQKNVPAQKDAATAVTIGNVGGNITGSIITGRDVVKNIIVVGQFLDFAKVEGLLPRQNPCRPCPR